MAWENHRLIRRFSATSQKLSQMRGRPAGMGCGRPLSPINLKAKAMADMEQQGAATGRSSSSRALSGARSLKPVLPRRKMSLGSDWALEGTAPRRQGGGKNIQVASVWRIL
jgi:hypothetical protein